MTGPIWSELLEDESRQLAVLQTEGLDIRVLQGATTEIAGVRIIGATLWTDLQLYSGLEHLARIVVSAHMQDYRAIYTASETRFTIDDMLERHRQDKGAILDALRNPHDGPTVVMSHHLPVRQLLHPGREIGGDAKRSMNAGFANDLWAEIWNLDIHTWICGHSHEARSWIGDGERGQIRFVMNQRGYPGEKTGFDAEFIVEI